MPDQVNDFSQRYQQFNDRKLLEIIQNESDYLPEAIVAAKKELASRELTEEEISELKKEVEGIKSMKVNWDWMNSQLVNRLRGWWTALTLDRKIGTMTAFALGFWVLFRGYRNYDLAYMLQLFEPALSFNWFEVYLFLPYLIIAVAIPLLLYKKKAGWILATILASTFTLFQLWDAFSGFIWLMFLSGPSFYTPLYSYFWFFFIQTLILFVAAGIPIVLHLGRVRRLYKVETYWVILANWVGVFWVIFFNWWFS